MNTDYFVHKSTQMDTNEKHTEPTDVTTDEHRLFLSTNTHEWTQMGNTQNPQMLPQMNTEYFVHKCTQIDTNEKTTESTDVTIDERRLILSTNTHKWTQMKKSQNPKSLNIL